MYKSVARLMACRVLIRMGLLRDASDLVELPRIFTENRRPRAQSEVLLRVALCQQKRAYVPAAARGR